MKYIKKYKLYEEEMYLCDPDICIRRNRYDQLEEWLKSGGDPNFRSITSLHLLSLAAKKTNPEITDLLLKYGANPDSQNERNYTALIYAVIENGIDVVKSLIDSNADLDLYTNTFNYTALIYAAVMKNYKIMSMLIDAGADWSIVDTDDKSFLDKLIQTKREKIINLYPEKYKIYIRSKQVKKFKI